MYTSFLVYALKRWDAIVYVDVGTNRRGALVDTEIQRYRREVGSQEVSQD